MTVLSYIAVFVTLALSQASAAQWFEYSPPGSVAAGQGILSEVLSRCDQRGLQTVANLASSKTTHCHEATHMLNSRMREDLGLQQVNAFYVGYGQAIVLPEPRTTLERVGKRVTQYRNSTFQLYFVGGLRDWNNQPLYVLDEYSAYVNGSQAALESGHDDHGSIDRAIWFGHYSDALVATVQAEDPQYEYLQDLAEFVQLQKERVAEIAGNRQQVPVIAPLDNSQQLADLAPSLRQRNLDSSCVHATTVDLLRWLGMYDEADQWYANYRGGESPGPHRAKLDASGLKYVMTTDGDESVLEYAVSSRRGAGVTWGGAHCVALIGRERDQAVLMGNGPRAMTEYHRLPWSQFLSDWRNCGGWAFVILSGEVPPPTPRAWRDTPCYN